jgi:hypothetical protein
MKYSLGKAFIVLGLFVLVLMVLVSFADILATYMGEPDIAHKEAYRAGLAAMFCVTILLQVTGVSLETLRKKE